MAVVIGLTLYGEFAFLGLLTLIAAFSLHEYYNIVFQGRERLRSAVFILLGVGIVWMKFWFDEWSIYCIPMLLPVSAFFILFSTDRQWKHLVYLPGGLLYIALPLFFFHLASLGPEPVQESPGMEYKPLLALNLFVLIWCSDTFAYLSGKAFGKHKLFEQVSPGKTWEGFAGGLLLTTAFSFLLAHYFGIPYRVNALVALCTVVFGTLGDLVESMLKREFGIKDSGHILPGHGGMLDRFDALLISLPFTTAVYHFML